MSKTRISQYFGELKDARIERTKRHQMIDIIMIALCGIISGADNWVEIVEWGHAKEDWLRGFLELPNGIPSHDTFSDVFARLDRGAFQRCFMAWVRAAYEVTAGQVIALDGKTCAVQPRSHRDSGLFIG